MLVVPVDQQRERESFDYDLVDRSPREEAHLALSRRVPVPEPVDDRESAADEDTQGERDRVHEEVLLSGVGFPVVLPGLHGFDTDDENEENDEEHQVAQDDGTTYVVASELLCRKPL